MSDYHTYRVTVTFNVTRGPGQDADSACNYVSDFISTKGHHDVQSWDVESAEDVTRYEFPDDYKYHLEKEAGEYPDADDGWAD